MELPADLNCLTNTIWALSGCLNQLNFASEYYNQLNTNIPDYQKPLLQKLIVTFETEIRKVCGSCTYQVLTNGERDDNFVNRMSKMGDYIVSSQKQF